MKSTFRLLFYVKREKLKSNGKVPIFVRITKDGERIHFSIKQEVTLSIWSGKMGRAEGRTNEAIILNTILDNIRAQIEKHNTNYLLAGQNASPEMLRNAYLGLDVRNDTLLKVFANFNERHEKLIGIDISQSTYNKYDLTYRRLSEFMQDKMNMTDIGLNRINLDFLLDFESYLRVDHKLSTNSAEKLIRIFKRIVGIARANGLMRADPFVNYKIKKEKKDRGFLTQEELELIMNQQFDSDRLNKVKDIFIFCCFTGLAYSDVLNLTTDNICTGFDGDLWIMTHRQKTGVKSNIKLLDIPVSIIRKYEAKRDTNRLLPVMSNAKFNDYIKEIVKACGIEKYVTVHMARHTFATTVTLANGVPIESVSKMLGHTNIKTTQIYARILDEKVSADMDMLAAKLNGRMTNTYVNN